MSHNKDDMGRAGLAIALGGLAGLLLGKQDQKGKEALKYGATALGGFLMHEHKECPAPVVASGGGGLNSLQSSPIVIYNAMSEKSLLNNPYTPEEGYEIIFGNPLPKVPPNPGAVPRELLGGYAAFCAIHSGTTASAEAARMVDTHVVMVIYGWRDGVFQAMKTYVGTPGAILMLWGSLVAEAGLSELFLSYADGYGVAGSVVSDNPTNPTDFAIESRTDAISPGYYWGMAVQVWRDYPYVQKILDKKSEEINANEAQEVINWLSNMVRAMSFNTQYPGQVSFNDLYDGIQLNTSNKSFELGFMTPVREAQIRRLDADYLAAGDDADDEDKRFWPSYTELHSGLQKLYTGSQKPVDSLVTMLTSLKTKNKTFDGRFFADEWLGSIVTRAVLATRGFFDTWSGAPVVVPAVIDTKGFDIL